MQKFHNYVRFHKTYSRENRSRLTLTEKIMRNILRKDQLGYRFLRQKPIGPYILDFYCAKLQLCIEVDGSSHQWKEDYDKQRDDYLATCWITTWRFSAYDLLVDASSIEKKIREWIETLA